MAQWLPQASWKQKLNAALEMLKIAVQFTKGFSGFRLYATDLSLYNIAVGSDDSLKIIDGENIIVVDLQKVLQGIFFILFYFFVFQLKTPSKHAIPLNQF